MSEDFGVGEVDEKKGLVGGVKYVIQGEKFASKQEAIQRRQELIDARRAEHEQNGSDREYQNKINVLIDVYDAAPEYITRTVYTNPITDKEKHWWRGVTETGLSAVIDPNALNNDLWAPL